MVKGIEMSLIWKLLRSYRLALIGLVAMVGLTIPTAAQANTSPVLQLTRTFSINLPTAQCATVTHYPARPAAGCAGTATIHLSAVTEPPARPGTRPATYWYGYLDACATRLNDGDCDPNNWWADDAFHVTTDGRDAWNNGNPSCTANGTDLTWCSYTNNGQPVLSEGMNFGNGGWARIYIAGNETHSVGGPSWANVDGNLGTS